jgi:hypothetical protein
MMKTKVDFKKMNPGSFKIFIDFRGQERLLDDSEPIGNPRTQTLKYQFRRDAVA